MGKATFDAGRAKGGIDRLRTVGRQLNNVKDGQYNEKIKALGEQWKGEASTAYIKKARVLDRELETTIKLIDKLANTMEMMVVQLEKSEI